MKGFIGCSPNQRCPAAQRLWELVAKQAEDPGLWFMAEYETEAYLQAALRKLHDAIEEAFGET
jgi:hypothetical protein